MFKITIEETKLVKKIVGKDWAVVGSKEVGQDPRYCIVADAPKTYMEDVRGYTPEVEKLVEVKSDILIQEVETLDLPAVIKAINNLK